MTTATAAPTARYQHVALAQAEALLVAHALEQPLTLADSSAWMTWGREHDALGANRNLELARVRHLLCWKCAGTGETQWRHRSGGVCYACKGDGHSAAGRRAAR